MRPEREPARARARASPAPPYWPYTGRKIRRATPPAAGGWYEHLLVRENELLPVLDQFTARGRGFAYWGNPEKVRGQEEDSASTAIGLPASSPHTAIGLPASCHVPSAPSRVRMRKTMRTCHLATHACLPKALALAP